MCDGGSRRLQSSERALVGALPGDGDADQSCRQGPPGTCSGARHWGQWPGVWGARGRRQVRKEEVLHGPHRVRLWAEGAAHANARIRAALTCGVCMQNMAEGDPRKENGATSWKAHWSCKGVGQYLEIHLKSQGCGRGLETHRPPSSMPCCPPRILRLSLSSPLPGF